MATREQRLAEFTTEAEPAADLDLELLCEDHVGTYTLPFPCRRVEGGWLNTRTGETVQQKVLGWRSWVCAKGFGPKRTRSKDA